MLEQQYTPPDDEATKPHLSGAESATQTSVGQDTEPLVNTDADEWLTPLKGEGPDVQSNDSSTASEATDSLDEDTQNPFQREGTPSPASTAAFDEVTPAGQPTEFKPPQTPPEKPTLPENEDWNTPNVVNNPQQEQDEQTLFRLPQQEKPYLDEPTAEIVKPEYIPPGGKIEETDYSFVYAGQLQQNQPMLIGRDSLRNSGQVDERYAIGFSPELQNMSREQLQIVWRTGKNANENRIQIFDNRKINPDRDVEQQLTRLNGEDITQSEKAEWQELNQGDVLELNGVWFDVKVCDKKNGIVKIEKVDMERALPHILDQENISDQVKGWEDAGLVDDNWVVKFDQIKNQPGSEMIQIIVFAGLLANLWRKWITNPGKEPQNQKLVIPLLSGKTLKEDIEIILEKIGRDQKVKGMPLERLLETVVEARKSKEQA